jgi:hypothetical protein
MKEIQIADRRFRLWADQLDGRWTARAFCADTGDPFGVDSSGATEDEAIGRLIRWLDWQHAHAEALEALQFAERAYHRTIAGSAFASAAKGPSPLELHPAVHPNAAAASGTLGVKASLEAVDAARIRLDTVRARQPR